ncbi:hypothetical protein [Lysobacter gummosus]|uniref:hypothetical protein n=1 Tax=Lysobacter gummosus TaxID=262324 RepID=UPI00071EF434|nr:hypothetical protein LG3211_1305 [Lysobacter gummosus]
MRVRPVVSRRLRTPLGAEPAALLPFSRFAGEGGPKGRTPRRKHPWGVRAGDRRPLSPQPRPGANA